MAAVEISDEELLAYLEESLPLEQSTQLESALRSSEELQERLAVLVQNKDQGAHTVGEIWRRQRLSCPSRSDLGRYVLEAMPQDEMDYIQFHLEQVGCRFCVANLNDLQDTQTQLQLEDSNESSARTKRHFESSAGFLSQIQKNN